MRPNILIKSILTVVVILVCYVPCARSAQFKDVPTGHWATEAVDQMVNEYGFMTGDPSGAFGGSRPLTRYEFAKTLARVVEYYNTEHQSTHKDTESLVSIMELFQKELKVLETKINTVAQQVEDQNKTISEVNQITVALGEQLKQDEQSSLSKPVVEARLVQLEENVNKLQHKGLVVDTLVKGSYYDVKKLGTATTNVFKNSWTPAPQEPVEQPVEQPVQQQPQSVQEVQQYNPFTQAKPQVIRPQIQEEETPSGSYYNLDIVPLPED